MAAAESEGPPPDEWDPHFERLCDIIDDTLQRVPPDPVFTPPVMTTGSLFGMVDAPRVEHKGLVTKLTQQGGLFGDVVVINSNFGRICQPGWEHKLSTIKKEPPPAAGHRRRQTEGHGGSFNMSLSPYIALPPGGEIAARLRAEGKSVVGYHILYFPTKGSLTISGSRLPDFADAVWAIETWVDFLNQTNLLGGPARFDRSSLRATGIDYKFLLRRWSPRQQINYEEVFRYIQNEGAHKMPHPPSPFSFTPASKNLKATFKLQPMRESKKRGKGPLVEFFCGSGKIGLLGAQESHKLCVDMHNFLSEAFRENWERFVVLQPRPDDAWLIDPEECAGAADALREELRAAARRALAEAAPPRP